MTPNILWAKKGEGLQRKLLNIFNDERSREEKGKLTLLQESSAEGTVGIEARSLGPRREPVERRQTGPRPLM